MEGRQGDVGEISPCAGCLFEHGVELLCVAVAPRAWVQARSQFDGPFHAFFILRRAVRKMRSRFESC